MNRKLKRRNRMVDVNKIIAYEQGDMTIDDTIKMFQEMIDDGSVWILQGHYGRTAQLLIEEGLCHSKKQTKSRYPQSEEEKHV